MPFFLFKSPDPIVLSYNFFIPISIITINFSYQI